VCLNLQPLFEQGVDIAVEVALAAGPAAGIAVVEPGAVQTR